MLLATRCPHCKTTFKVANDQLKLQSGLVRCGVCSQVFNGIEQLTPAHNASTNISQINAPTAPATNEPEEPEYDLFDEFDIAPHEEIKETEKIEEIVLEKADEADQTLPPQMPTDLRSLLVGGAADESGPEHDDEEEIAKLTFVRHANRRKMVTRILSIATFLLFVAFIGQIVFQFRDYLAAAYPVTKNALVALCRLANCQINFPATADAISYEADELHTLPRDNTYEFSLLMRNRSTLTQTWPAIELTLKDSKKEIVLRRVFSPIEYLESAKDVAGGFSAHQEQAIKLYFTLDQIQASDYVVAVFYP